MTIKMRVLLAGISFKIQRGEGLEDILDTYINLTEAEKDEIKQYMS